MLHDFAGATGQARLSAAVTQAARDCSRAPRMARVDAEVRYDDNRTRRWRSTRCGPGTARD
eukprot:3595330-Prymnesium_polylepis.1